MRGRGKFQTKKVQEQGRVVVGSLHAIRLVVV